MRVQARCRAERGLVLDSFDRHLQFNSRMSASDKMRVPWTSLTIGGAVQPSGEIPLHFRCILQRGKIAEQPQVASMEARHQVSAPENFDPKQAETGETVRRRGAPPRA